MSLLLSSTDTARVNHAARVLLSPFAFENGSAWRREAARAIEPLVNASRSFSGMTLDGEDFWTGEEDVVSGLSGTPIPDFAYRGAVERRIDLRLDVADWTDIYDVREARASSFYEEVVRPLELFAPLMIITELPGMHPSAFWNPPFDGGRESSLMMLGFCSSDESRALRTLERRRALLQLLTPSFAAGVRVYTDAREREQGFSKLIDTIAAPMAILDAAGRFLHRNHALTALLAHDVEHEQIERAIKGAARNLSMLRLGRYLKATPDPVVQTPTTEVRTATGRHAIHLALLEGLAYGPTDFVLAVVERCEAATSSCARLAKQYRLTARETQVLRYLSTGMSTRQVAGELRISVNTARRHVEHILSRLGVHSRVAAIAKLREH